MVMERLLGDRRTTNVSALARAVGCSQSTLSNYKADVENIKNGKARTVARLAKFHRFSAEEKARLLDELAE